MSRRNTDTTTANDAIALSVQEAWNHLPSSKISKIIDRLPIVHRLIVDDRCGNCCVQERRGLRKRDEQRPCVCMCELCCFCTVSVLYVRRAQVQNREFCNCTAFLHTDVRSREPGAPEQCLTCLASLARLEQYFA